MSKNMANYFTAMIFFLIPLRDMLFPGWFQIHSGSSNRLLCFVLGCSFLAYALGQSRKDHIHSH